MGKYVSVCIRKQAFKNNVSKEEDNSSHTMRIKDKTKKVFCFYIFKRYHSLIYQTAFQT